MTRVLIIGTTGVLGRELVPLLKAKGYAVRGLVRPESKAKLQAAHEAGLPESEVAYGNIMDKASLVEAMRGVDVVISCVSAGQDRTAASRQCRTLRTNERHRRRTREPCQAVYFHFYALSEELSRL